MFIYLFVLYVSLFGYTYIALFFKSSPSPKKRIQKTRLYPQMHDC